MSRTRLVLVAAAERNRELVIHAAREVFAEQGLDAPTNEVARRAGVGVGVATLFRRFPTRDSLIAATFADKMHSYADAIDSALVEPDPWQGFCGYIERVCAMQAQAAGCLRPDFVHQDVPLILMANAGVLRATGDAAPDAYLLQAFAAETAQPLPDPPTPTRVYRALMRLNQAPQ